MDDRLFARLREIEKAKDCLQDYKLNPSKEMERIIGRCPSGFFSIWMALPTFLWKHV